MPTTREHHSLDRLKPRTMATSQPEEMTIQEAVEQIAKIEVEEEADNPLEGLTNADIAEIYNKLKPEDRHLFRQFKHFHKTYYNLHGHDAPSHQLARGIVNEIFSGLPSRDAETIANTHVELLAAERLKDLSKKLGLAISIELQMYQPPEALEYPPPPSLLHFPSHQDKERQAAQAQAQAQVEQQVTEADVKPNIKPPQRLVTSYLGKPGLLRMLGSGDEDHIITKVLPGMAPLQEYDEDYPSQIITINYETDDSDDVDDLSEVSMTSAGGITKDKFQGLLADIAAQHQKMAASIDTFAALVEDMTVEQVEEAAIRVTSEIGHIRGMDKITGVFDKAKVGLILATGVWKFHEYQSLKGNREEKDIVSYRQLEKKFRANKRMVMECSQVYKYRYPKGVSTKVPFTLTKLEEEGGTPSATEMTPGTAATLTPATSTAAETVIPTTTT